MKPQHYEPWSNPASFEPEPETKPVQWYWSGRQAGWLPRGLLAVPAAIAALVVAFLALR